MRAFINLIFSLALPFLAAALAHKDVAQSPLHVHVASEASALPESSQKQLRDVKRGVEALKVPGGQAVLPPSSGALAPCSFIGGLLSSKLSPRCCASVQVISQRRLSDFGLSKNCEPGWECEADGKTPTQSFEARSLSSLCGEPGCLPRVTKAMKQNWKTSFGAGQMSNICSQLGVLGADADASTMSSLLREEENKTEADGDDAEGKTWNATSCQEEICDVKSEAEKLCEVTREKKHPCYKRCCGSPQCFPGEATVSVEGSGSVPMSKIQVGDRILVESAGRLVYEPILAFLHAHRGGPSAEMPYLTVSHARGQFRASSTHLVFVQSPGEDWTNKAVSNLQIGDQILAAMGGSIPLVPSRVVGISHSSGNNGMFAPLTFSGTAVVDGVLASNYASPSASKHLSHHAAHAFLFPVRVYHQLGFATALKPMWAWLCPARPAAQGALWLCHGSGLQQGDVEADETHPFVTVMWKLFKLDWILPKQK